MPGFVTDSTCVFPILTNGDTIPYPSSIASITINIQDSSLNIVPNEREGDFWSVFPNPTTDKINIRVSEFKQELSLRIYDVAGRFMKNIKINSEEFQVSLNHLPKGTYHLILFEKNKPIDSKRIVVR